MEIKGNVYCLFEQSGTFKNEFLKLGINAYDYDIQNNFGQTTKILSIITFLIMISRLRYSRAAYLRIPTGSAI